MKRINIVGTSGSGKTTFARQLARQLACPCYEMDALFWKPGWVESSDDEFLARLRSVTAAEAWVLDGNYNRSTPVKWERADTVIWLDYSFGRTLFQALKRALGRCLLKREIWPGTGNTESFRRTFLSKDSVLLWTLTTYAEKRRRYQAMMTSDEYPHIRFIRLSSPGSARAFLARVASEPTSVPQ